MNDAFFVGAFLQLGTMTRSAIAKKVGLTPEEVLEIERIQNQNRVSRAALASRFTQAIGRSIRNAAPHT